MNLSKVGKSLFTSESVTVGHPDKICDQISDSILDAFLEKDPNARVACEVAVNTGLVLVFGEITADCSVDITSVVRKTINEIGYDNGNYGFDGNTCSVLVCIDKQSADIAQGVDHSLADKTQFGAGDQGLMFGYACNETEDYMPLPIYLSHKLAKQLHKVRVDGTLPYLRPDGKTQVTIEYDGDHPVAVDTVVCSTQHSPDVSLETIQQDIMKHVIKAIIPENMLTDKTKYYINPTGRFVIGGPVGDAGLTGRKIIVDTYGGYARHGGGAFSGKDPTKVDRSGCYAARHVAKNIVAAGLADKCEVQVAYAIGVAEPVSIRIETFGTGKITEEELVGLVNKNFDLSPSAIIKNLGLKQPIYKQTAAYGHFGRSDVDLPWERLDKVSFLQKL